MTPEQREWLQRRIQQLQSLSRIVGPYRQAGISRTIAGMQKQLKDGVWRPHNPEA